METAGQNDDDLFFLYASSLLSSLTSSCEIRGGGFDVTVGELQRLARLRDRIAHVLKFNVQNKHNGGKARIARWSDKSVIWTVLYGIGMTLALCLCQKLGGRACMRSRAHRHLG